MDNFLKEKRLINFDSERSKAESQLKNMLKDLTAKKRKAEQGNIFDSLRRVLSRLK